MKDREKNIGQIGPDQVQVQGIVKRRVYGEEVDLPVGGEQVGKSGFTIFEARKVDSLHAEKLREINATEVFRPRGLFDLD